MYYLCAWSTTLPCLIVGGGIVYEGGRGFSLIFKMGKSKQNYAVELWKFSIKKVGC